METGGPISSDPGATVPSPPCPNCTSSAGRYCPACGQDNAHPRLETRAVLADSLANLVNWDSKVWRTVRGLVTAPSVVVADYVAGRRQTYVQPARFCLIALALWLLATRWLGLDAMAMAGIHINATGDLATAEAPRAELVALAVRGFLARHLDILLYLSLPIRAALVRFAFRTSGRNFAEDTVLVLYLAGFGYLVALATTPLVALGWSGAAALHPLLGLVWFVRAVRGFFEIGWWTAIWKALLVVFGHVAGTALLFGAIAVPWVLLTGA
jgi:hypothetical protein